MATKIIFGGVVHTVPKDLREALLSNSKAQAAWQDSTPLAHNEWICWVLNAKKEETRKRRIKLTCTELAEGIRRPCCWAGCTHRLKKEWDYFATISKVSLIWLPIWNRYVPGEILRGTV